MLHLVLFLIIFPIVAAVFYFSSSHLNYLRLPPFVIITGVVLHDDRRHLIAFSTEEVAL